MVAVVVGIEDVGEAPAALGERALDRRRVGRVDGRTAPLSGSRASQR